MRHSFHTEQWVPYPVATVFLFFSDPDNLPRLMPTWQKPRLDSAALVPPPADPSGLGGKAAGTGSRLTFSFLPFPGSPFRLRWLAEISEFTWDRRFCDRQVTGPFAYWYHCHRVLPVRQAGVEGSLVVDDLEYELPLGVAGEFAHRLFVRRQIERTFLFRQSRLADILAADILAVDILTADINSENL